MFYTQKCFGAANRFFGTAKALRERQVSSIFGDAIRFAKRPWKLEDCRKTRGWSTRKVMEKDGGMSGIADRRPSFSNDQHMRIEPRYPACIFTVLLPSSTLVARGRQSGKHIPLFRSKRFTISSDLFGERKIVVYAACFEFFFSI